MACNFINKGDEIPMDKYFLHGVQCMLSDKTDEYRAELMRRLKKANAYMNKIGRSVHSTQIVVLMMMQLDEEFPNEGFKEDDETQQ